jgi:transcription-repair coupling factor (superfamily II helicase)
MTPPLSALVERWAARPAPEPSGLLVVPQAVRAFWLAGLATQRDGPVLAIVAGERDAEDLADDIELFLPTVFHLPAWETLPFEHVSPNVATMAARMQARHILREGTAGSVVVASVRAAVQRVSPSAVTPIELERGQSADFEATVQALAGLGYERTDRVESRGQMAVRGGIVDLYPAQAAGPVRIDFWGDEIDEITRFSVATQRSEDAVDRAVIFPAREMRPDSEMAAAAAKLSQTDPWAAAEWERIAEGVSFPGIESWLPWLTGESAVIDEAHQATSIVLFEPSRARDRATELLTEESELAAALASTWGPGAPEAGDHPALYLDLGSLLPLERTLEAPVLAAGPGADSITIGGFDAVAGDAESVAAAIGALISRGSDVLVAMDGVAAADRVARLLGEAGLSLPRRGTIESGSGIIATGIHHGFVLAELGVAVLGEREIAGRRRAHRRVGVRSVGGTAATYGDLTEGDFVVHHIHGIGRFEGLVTRSLVGVERDYLLVAYAGQDKLYVPTDQLAAIRKYTGGESPRLSRMGGTDWERTRGRVRQAVAAVAEEVVALHRARAQVPGHAHAPDSPWQREMEAAFPFEETPDQLTAIADVKADMESGDPMDRLIFGDVGFGKTEVAVRAAFKAVQDGRQVVVLCPTTLLAQQHQQTFSERFAPYPVRVEMLSRFLTPKQQRAVAAGVGDGSVDVVIGTHRLLSDDVSLDGLGLLVVDEEQRFGVSAKDRIKALRTSVDVLTLTATPIPRTLELALTGIRKVSRIATPPEDRHPILTFVGPHDERAVSAAIRREMLREGQVFFVHNRVQSIDHAVVRLQALVPEARYAVAHGQMNEGQLEQVMLDFWNGEYDVLVATTIIESGLDLPQVNTLIVERADMLGLAQLYQLRGRVGRSSQRAYAYLFHPEDQRLSEEAHRRLEAIGEFGDLGSGFQLAMRDLEIRGAGSILGNVQSGHLSAVGFDLYIEMVADAVAELETGQPAKAKPTQVRIDLAIVAHLPEAYVPDQSARLEAYRRLAAAEQASDVDDVVSEWIDRYGPLPENAESLIGVARLRVEALRVGIEDIVAMRREVKISPVRLTSIEEVRLQRLSRSAVVRGSALFLPVPTEEPAMALIDFFRTMWPPDLD